MKGCWHGLFLDDSPHRDVGTVVVSATSCWLQRHAEQDTQRPAAKLERLRADGVIGQAAIARALTERGVPTPRGSGAWTHTTVARLMARAMS
ncbi:hypothetical protein CKO45_20445 [Paracraurococcus ruber]|uniref:Recombinase domain-containing protein n=1 Tax=Paracraurococcus ruber TaxID=77675 RepID=A0ABS1D1A3_9PROT|nr:hypothetical protein [Paracraurococcus ruber]